MASLRNIQSNQNNQKRKLKTQKVNSKNKKERQKKNNKVKNTKRIKPNSKVKKKINNKRNTKKQNRTNGNKKTRVNQSKLNTRKRKKDNSLSIMDDDLKHWLIGISVFLIIYAVVFMSVQMWSNSQHNAVATTQTGNTYYQYLTDQKQAKAKEARNTDVKHIAEKLLMQQTGLASNDNVYRKTGTYSKDVFINKAVMDGNNVPVSSDFAGDDTGAYSTFTDDDETFKKIRENSYQEMKEKAQKDLSNEDNKQQQLADLKNEINKARRNQGELTKNQNKNKNLKNKDISSQVN